MTLRGKTVLVTGGARGIGRAIAAQALEQEANVAIWAFNRESLDEANLTHLAYSDSLDIGRSDQVRQGYARLVNKIGPVDVLINNAGYTLTSRFIDEREDYWHRVVDTNFWGVVYLTQLVLPDMQLKKCGSIVNVVSDAGRVGMGGEAVYAGAKGGVIAFTKSIAQEVARDNIRVNAVAPGPTRTRILETNTEDGDAEKLIEKMIRRIPMKRIAEPDEIAASVLFLAGESASHITGQVLSVSGGLTMV